MDRQQLIKKVEKVLSPILEAKGLILVDIEFKGLGSRSILSVYIDGKTRPVTLKECEDTSGLLSLELDALDLIDHAYVLEVSSPGLDRILKTDRELKWAIGKKVKVYLEDGREKIGRLTDFDEENYKIVSVNNTENILRKKVRKIKLDEV